MANPVNLTKIFKSKCNNIKLTEKLVELAYNAQPQNYLLYGDTSRPLSRNDIKNILDITIDYINNQKSMGY